MTKMSALSRRTMLGLTVVAASMVSLPAMSADFSGETIEWVIPFKEGGGSDKWSRFYAPLLSEALPGNPNVIVKNMPGAGSTKGANWFAKNAKPDGLTIFGTSGSTQFPYLLGDPRVKYEYKDWNIVLATATGGVAYLPPDIAEKWAADKNSILEEDFIYGSQGATRLDLVPLLAWEMLGMNVEPIFGIKGRGEGRLMFERGEVNIDYQTSSGFLGKVTPLVEAGQAVPMMTWGALDEQGNIVRDPTFPDIPTFKEVYTEMKGEEPSGDAWEAWKAFFVAGFPAQKMVFLPNGTSQEIIDAYTAAFNAVISRPDFAEISKKRLGVYPQSTGQAAQVKLKQGTEVADSASAWVKAWLKDRYGVELN
ncbi:MAG: tripartite tricarboxylate transporter substrate-binding protein [Pseudomonadota bacterium]